MYLPPLKNHPSRPIGFVYSPFEKSPIKTHWFYVPPPFKKSLFLVGVDFSKSLNLVLTKN